MRPYLRAANVTWSGLDLADVKEMNFTDAEVATYRLEPGDILLSEASGSADEVGKAAMWRGERTGPMCFQNTLLRVRPAAGVLPEFLHLRLLYEALSGGFARSSRGVGIHHLGAAKLAAFEVELPPAEEQRRIVNALEEHQTQITSVLQNLETVHGLCKRVPASARVDGLKGHKAVGRNETSPSRDTVLSLRAGRAGKLKAAAAEPLPMSTPPQWPTLSLSEISWDIDYGTSTRCAYDGHGVDVLRIPNIAGGAVSTADMKRAVDPSVDLGKNMVAAGDVLIVRSNGSRDLIGRCAAVPAGLDASFASYLIRCRVLTEVVAPEWLVLVLSSPHWRGLLEARAASTAGQYNLSIDKLASLPVPVPPLPVQSAILMRVDAHTEIAEAASAALAAVTARGQALWRSVLAAAFRGDLLPQESSDEPAELLLKRIAEDRALSAPTARRRRARSVPAASAAPDEESA